MGGGSAGAGWGVQAKRRGRECVEAGDDWKASSVLSVCKGQTRRGVACGHGVRARVRAPLHGMRHTVIVDSSSVRSCKALRSHTVKACALPT